MKVHGRWWRPAASYLAVVIPSTLALAVLLNADILLVKHFFASNVAGEYAAIAALGRAIFWGASGVATVLFPKVVFRRTKGAAGFGLVGVSLLLVVLGGLVSLSLLALSARWLLIAFAGQTYAEVAWILPWYGVGMILLGGGAVLIAAHQTHGNASFLAILLPLTLLEPVSIWVFHGSLAQVVAVVDLSMALVFVGLGILYLAQETRVSTQLPTQVQGVASDTAQVG
jgi:hypothetical protein